MLRTLELASEGTPPGIRHARRSAGSKPYAVWHDMGPARTSIEAMVRLPQSGYCFHNPIVDHPLTALCVRQNAAGTDGRCCIGPKLWSFIRSFTRSFTQRGKCFMVLLEV